MKHLFVVKPGSSGMNRRLDRYGVREAEILGMAMEEIFNGSSFYIISSTAPSALDVSEILEGHLAVPKFEQIKYLWSEENSPDGTFYHDQNLDRLIQIVNERRDRADALVMVIHSRIVREFPTYFLRKEFRINGEIELPKGKAVHFDLENRSYELFP